MELRIKIELILNESCEMGAQNARFVVRGSRSVVANGWVFAECHTNANDLLPVRCDAAFGVYVDLPFELHPRGVA